MNTSWKEIFQRLNNKYRLVVMNDSTLEERLSFRLSRMNVYVAASTLAVVLIILTAMAIVLTPIKEYIPGYQDINMRKNVIDLSFRADSLERMVSQKEVFISSIQKVLNGESFDSVSFDSDQMLQEELEFDSIALEEITPDDSTLRKEMENQEYYALLETANDEEVSTIAEINFYKPLQGFVSDQFDPSKEHFGIDIVGKEKEPIKAILDGVVVFHDWTMDTGYVIGIQHDYNLLSFYKHNSVLLKKMGTFVKAGDAIAIVGNSGEHTTGPHLHFEMWYERQAVNPLDYLTY